MAIKRTMQAGVRGGYVVLHIGRTLLTRLWLYYGTNMDSLPSLILWIEPLLAAVAVRLALYVKLSPYSIFRPQVTLTEDPRCTHNPSFHSYFNMYDRYSIPPLVSPKSSFLDAPRLAIAISKEGMGLRGISARY